MDLAMRTLRDGSGEAGAAAPLLLLCDTLAVVGGPALLRQASLSAPWVSHMC